jgi:hypothetical protein
LTHASLRSIYKRINCLHLVMSEPDDSNFGPPFDFADGDVYLRSVDGCHFCVHKALLSVASHTFREMLSAEFGGEERNGLPVIPFVGPEEDKFVVAAFLQIIYPLGTFTSHSDSLDVIHQTLELGRKYQCDRVRDFFNSVLPSHADLKRYPIRFYALGCVYQLEHVARAAALEAISQDLDLVLKRHQQFSHLRILSGDAVVRLFAFRASCTDAVHSAGGYESALQLCRTTAVFLEDHHDKEALTGNPNCPVDGDLLTLLHEDHVLGDPEALPRAWWTTYIDACMKELSTFPSPAVVRRVTVTGPALMAASNCKQCCKRASDDLETFIQQYEAHLRQAIEEVSVFC